MTIVLTWTIFKWAIIPILFLFFFGLAGVLPDNNIFPVRLGIFFVSGIMLLVWLIIFSFVDFSSEPNRVLFCLCYNSLI